MAKKGYRFHIVARKKRGSTEKEFVFELRNGAETVMRSRAYARKANAKMAIKSVQRWAATADIIDDTVPAAKAK